jgi:hypothetical protein
MMLMKYFILRAKWTHNKTADYMPSCSTLKEIAQSFTADLKWFNKWDLDGNTSDFRNVITAAVSHVSSGSIPFNGPPNTGSWVRNIITVYSPVLSSKDDSL